MSINPLDVMRSQEITQYKNAENTRLQHDQVQISKNFQSMIQSDNTKPTQTTKSDNKEFRYDAKEKGRNGYFGSGSGKKKEEEAKKDTKKPGKTGGIDILI